MALDLTPEQKTIGTGNFRRAVGKLATRRDFMRDMLAAGSVVPLGAAAYFSYDNSSFRGRPVKAGLIGAGDEGGVLVGEHNPEYLQFIAYSDIRPTNQRRIFDGDARAAVRKGFNYHYGSNARANIRLYEDYKEMLKNPDIEAVVIALPLNLHAEVAIAAMEANKHVLCEKLMAWDIGQCKRMIKIAKDKDKLLSIGHQRHYSMLYAHANDVVKSGVLGEVRHIRALWHRNNIVNDSWRRPVDATDQQHLKDSIRNFGWTSVEQLVRWRLFRETGGGLMAELGSHQLDACSIFLGKRKPLSITAVGGKNLYKDEREIEDHVYCIFEFPGQNRNPDDPVRARGEHGVPLEDNIVTVTYSSINTNGFEPYGECVMGSKGTLIVEKEENAYLYGDGGRNTSVTVGAAGGAPVLSTSSTTSEPANSVAQRVEGAMGLAIPSKGYREEMEHLAFLIRNRDQATSADRANMKPRCDGEAALGDAVMALTTNIAMRDRTRIDFRREWFDPNSDRTPEGDHPYRS